VRIPSAFSDPRHHFETVLGLIVAALVFQMAAPDANWSRLVTVGLQGSVFVAAMGAAGASSWIVGRVAVVVVAAVSVLAVLLLGLGFPLGGAVPRLASLSLVLLASAGIVIGVREGVIEDRRVTLQTVFGGLCIYLLAGLGYAYAFSTIQDIGADPFFSGGVAGDPNDFAYFSLVTLSTTGYGDFTAASQFGRTVAVTEAVAGQVYLVTVVALLVSNVGRSSPAGPGLGRLVEEGEARHGTESSGSSPADPEP
jgi:hypothetical protein